MKRYVPIIIGVVALCAVLYIGSISMNSRDKSLANEESAASQVTSKSFQGSVTRAFEGDNTLDYGFDLPETATATVSMDGALVKVSEMDAPVLAMYVSYEGGRGYSPEDYITNNIIPKVSNITQAGTTTVGGYDWTVVESANSEWHVASVENGNWLLVVENTKANHEKAMSVLSSVAVSSPKVATEDASDTKESEGEQKTSDEASTSNK
jgi:hypothetical protein